MLAFLPMQPYNSQIIELIIIMSTMMAADSHYT